jgi:colanic acid/amylovoran biosynthesis glycosyltransferase
MRVLMVLIDFPALSETFILDQITGLIDRGFDVDILAARARKESTVHSDVEAYGLLDRVRYVDWKVPVGSRLLRWTHILFSLIRQGQPGLLNEVMRAGLRRMQKRPLLVGALQLLSYADALVALPPPDIVLCHFGPNGDLMVRLRKAFNAPWPVATFFHGYDISVLLDEKGPGVYDRLFRKGDLFLPASGFFRERLVDLGAPADRTAVHRMGVRFGTPSTEAEGGSGGWRREFVFVSVGRLVEKKGQEYAIRAIARCRQMDPEIKINLIIVGDGPLMGELYDTIRRLKLEGIVQMYGSLPREKINERLLAADAFVLPSVTAEDGDMEASPVAISEAMAAGLPVLATHHGGIPEIVDDEVTGLLVAERDVDALAEAMYRIARDHNLARRMGYAGRQKVERDLDLDLWNDVLAERIQTLVGAQKTKGSATVCEISGKSRMRFRATRLGSMKGTLQNGRAPAANRRWRFGGRMGDPE